MNIDNLIALIIVLIVIASQLRKLAKSGRNPGQKKRSGLKEQLGEMWTRLQRDLEAAKTEAAPPSGWEQFTPQPSEQLEDLDFEEVPTEPPHPQPAASEKALMSDAAEPTSLPNATAGAAAPGIKTPLPPGGVPSTAAWTSAFNSADLERAVIWSEIIGPPLALRNREEAT